MAVYSYDDYKKMFDSKQSRRRSNVGYFSNLKDGDYVIVRFDYVSPKDIEIVRTHSVKLNNSYRLVSCLREDNLLSSVEKCPFCACEDATISAIKPKVFVKLIEYRRDAETGKVTPVPVIWTRGVKFANELKENISEYGDLRNMLFKVTRSGQGMSTTYSVKPANTQVYRDDLGYERRDDLFKELDELELSPHSYLEKNSEDMKEFLRSGNFPYHKKESEQVESKSTPEVEAEKPVVASYSAEESKSTTVAEDTTYIRPRRTYDI